MTTKFWVWKFANIADASDDAIAKLEDFEGRKNLLLNIGQPLLMGLPILRFTCPKQIINDCIYNNQFCPLISCQLRNFLEKISNIKVEFYESELVEEGTLLLHQNFFAANFINLAQAVDLDRSDIEPHPIFLGDFGEIRRLVIDDSKVEGLGIFRLLEYPTALIVEDKIKTAIDEQNFTGIQWLPIEEYRTIG
jgi:hypothetical protein